MRLLPFFILLILLSSFTLAEVSENSRSNFNISGFVKREGDNMSIAKLLGAIILAFLLISGVYFTIKKKKK